MAPKSRREPETMLLAAALRRTLREGYSRDSFRADVLAGLVVGIVALPLSMALGIAVGVAPQHGLYTAIVAGSLVALLGGSRLQVTGPTAAFVVILAPIVTKYGLHGLLTAGLLAGLMLIAMGVARLGRLIQFIPHPVTTGFTAGIAMVIATLQMKDAFGLKVHEMPETYFGKVSALWHARGTANFAELAIALSTLFILIVFPRVTKRVPAPLVAIVAVTVGATLLHRFAPSIDVATIGSKFKTTIAGKTYAGIPPLPPTPMLPWGSGAVSFTMIRELLGPAFAIAILGAIESLLSAVIADGMSGTQHDPDAELVGLGIGNVVAPFFGGIAATGALARTATNVRSGAKSPFAALIHAALVLLAVLLLAPLVSYVPMAALAGLLLLVAWNMSELQHFIHIVKVAPKSDVSVLLACFVLTVVFDMVVAVSAGVVLAALLFMRRMAELTHARVTDESETEHREVPEGVVLYEIAGPLFFGAAANAMSQLAHIGSKASVVVLALGRVPAIDATGLVALESALERLHKVKKKVIIAGPLPEPRRVFEKANLSVLHDHLYFCGTLDEALSMARGLAEASG